MPSQGSLDQEPIVLNTKPPPPRPHKKDEYQFFKMGHSLSLFPLHFFFSILLTKWKINDDGTQTGDFWCCRPPRYQLCHNRYTWMLPKFKLETTITSSLVPAPANPLIFLLRMSLLAAKAPNFKLSESVSSEAPDWFVPESKKRFQGTSNLVWFVPKCWSLVGRASFKGLSLVQLYRRGIESCPRHEAVGKNSRNNNPNDANCGKNCRN